MVAAMTVGCAWWIGARPGLASCPGPLVSTEALLGDFLWRERVRYRAEDVEASFEFVVQKHGNTLIVVGLNEFGAKAFVVTQRGLEIDARSLLGPVEIVPPRTALHDLHRARLTPPDTVAAEAEDITLRPPGCGYAVTCSRLSTQRLEATP